MTNNNKIYKGNDVQNDEKKKSIQPIYCLQH